MANPLLEAPSKSSPETAIDLSQQASTFITSQSSWLSAIPYPLSLFINTESQEKWQTYENLFLACLRTGDDNTAYACLESLTDRFGKGNDRVVALQGLYKEATAKNESELAEVLREYEEMLKSDPTIFSIRKRRAAVLRSMGKTSDAVTALTNLLDQSPTDAEAWSELGDLYLTQGSYDQAIFSFEEVLLIMPYSWNMQARLGEVLYLASGRTEGGDQMKILSESMRRFCRSLELCDDYLRGHYGLKLVTTRLLEVLSTSKKPQQSSSDPVRGDLAPPSVDAVKKLNELATSKLAEIVRRSNSGEKGWDGYSAAEIIAARELLDRDTQKIER
ncbi:Inositol phosphatase SIW14 [Saxophila tyrrhenica]|uniref:ER membrane protein complex subunit 2 n=1 Tax=Saxophila tyrrhenica TaxID=1690608 RepID=A0AAV9PM33_9PEZI|nr:Inositol phosphatase SIW14 [Saxophila tyrrhenica]